jgi:hypothetical protein
VNIYTVKWGTKYSSEYVNKIAEDLQSLSPESHKKVFCITDDPSGLSDLVEPILIPEENDLEKWWNKMYLFSPLVSQEGEKLFFDLDILIQKEIKPFEEFDPENCLGIVKTWWHDLERMKEETKHVPHKFSDINSSILRWNENFDSEKLWEYFNKYKQQILWQYRGIDNFLCDKNIIPMKLFPIGWVYSFNQGYIFPQDTEKHVYREIPYICLFDSMGKSEDVKI